MQKILITFIVVLLVVGAALGVLVAFILHSSPSTPATGSNSTTTAGSSGGNSVSGSSANQQSGSTSGTQTTPINTTTSGDFLTAPDTQADAHNPGQYYLAGTAQNATSSKPYSILYV